MTARDYLKEPYARVLMPDETGGYYAEILELPGCLAEGDTVEETYRELENAAESWIDVRLARGQEIPAPFSNLDYSGNISLRLPRSIHKRAAIMADRDRTSLNTFLVSAVSTRIGVEDFYGFLADALEQRMARAAYAGYMAAYERIDDTATKINVSPRLQLLETRSTGGTTKQMIGG